MKLLFLLLNGAKLGKILLSSGTMLLSLFVYAWMYGWWYAVGFIALLFIHEMGHFIAAKNRGLDVGLPTFIPFVGAWIELKDKPINVETEAHIAFAGPLAGSIASALVYFVAVHYQSQLLFAISYAGFFLNLFNLIPISPLDGGRITAALSPKLWFVGLGMLLAWFYYHPNPLLVLLMIMAVPQLWGWWKHRNDPDADHRYYDLSIEKRFEYAVLYLGLIAYLAYMTFSVHQRLPS